MTYVILQSLEKEHNWHSEKAKDSCLGNNDVTNIDHFNFNVNYKYTF